MQHYEFESAPPQHLGWLNRRDRAAGIYPLAEAWHLLARRIADEKGIPLDAAGDIAADEMERAYLRGALQLYGYRASSGEPNETRRERIPAEEIQSLSIDFLQGQPQKEYWNERACREYGRATSPGHGSILWTGLCVRRDGFDAVLSVPSDTKSDPSPDQGDYAGGPITAAHHVQPMSKAETEKAGQAKTKRRRPDYERGDEDLVRGLRSAAIKVKTWKNQGSLPRSSRALARALIEADPDLRAKVGQEESWRKVIDGTHPRANRLADEGRVVPWWPVFGGYAG
jgi:hypothetical protein